MKPTSVGVAISAIALYKDWSIRLEELNADVRYGAKEGLCVQEYEVRLRN